VQQRVNPRLRSDCIVAGRIGSETYPVRVLWVQIVEEEVETKAARSRKNEQEDRKRKQSLTNPFIQMPVRVPDFFEGYSSSGNIRRMFLW